MNYPKAAVKPTRVQIGQRQVVQADASALRSLLSKSETLSRVLSMLVMKASTILLSIRSRLARSQGSGLHAALNLFSSVEKLALKDRGAVRRDMFIAKSLSQPAELR
jgi:hypothetical protein